MYLSLIIHCSAVLEDIRFVDAVQLLIDLLKTTLKTVNEQNSNVIEQIVEQFIERLPTSVKAKLAS